MMLGPHSPDWTRKWQFAVFDTVEPTERAIPAFNAEMRAALPDTAWVAGCDSWYLGQDGIPELWPWTPDRHGEMLSAEPDLADYALRVAARTGRR